MSAAATWNAGAILAETTIRMVGSDGFGRVRLWGGIGFAAGSLCTGVLDQRLPDLGPRGIISSRAGRLASSDGSARFRVRTPRLAHG